MKRLVICLGFFLFTVAGLTAGQDVVSFSILDIHSSRGGNVEMVVSVVDEQGMPIKGLNKANFKLSIEGKVIKEFSIEPVSGAKSPLSVILGIDVSGSMQGAPITEAKRAASIFFDRLNNEDFIALMAFGSSVRFLTEFTQKKHEVREEIEKLTANEEWTWLYQATYDGLDKAAKAPTSRVAIVLLTDGKDEGSPGTEEDVVGRIRGTQTPIYTLGFGPHAQVEYLKRVASMSRGYFLFTPRAEELARLYDLVLEQLKNQYLVEFGFANPPGDYASILTLSYRGREITARRGFLHFEVPDPVIPWWKEWSKKPVAWGMMTLAVIAIIAAGITIARLLRRPEPVPPAGKETSPEVSVMIRGKTHPIGLASIDLTDPKTVIAQPPKGEVGLKIEIPPLPIYSALIDKKNRKEYDEVIITRYDDKSSFSKEKVYLLLSDKAVSRPDERRQGHTKIFMDKSTGRYQIEDLGSVGGTKLNETALSGKVYLEDGDTITVGRTVLNYYDKRPTSETAF